MDKSQKMLFEELLLQNRNVVERYIHFRMRSFHDAEDVIQNTYLKAFRGFSALQDKNLFKIWLLAIARNECNYFFRHSLSRATEALGDVGDLSGDAYVAGADVVHDVLARLPGDAAQILELFYLEGKSIAQIAEALALLCGTVKSRLCNARKRFRDIAPSNLKRFYAKGDFDMENVMDFPNVLPELRLERADGTFLPVKWEEDSFIVPRLGERAAEATYRYPARTVALVSTLNVPKRAFVDDVEGVMVCRDTYVVARRKMNRKEKVWYSQLTDEYIRTLAVIDGYEGDDDEPVQIWTFFDESFDITINGNDRVHGTPTLVSENQLDVREGEITNVEPNVRYTDGRWSVTVGERTFDTVKLAIAQCGCLWSEFYLDANGRTVLLRTYESESGLGTGTLSEIGEGNTVTVNGERYVLTEDRLSAYVL